MKKILIIDDDIEFVNAVKILLESSNYRVITAGNTQKGIELIKKESPDLIVLDVMMDTMDEGFQFSYKLRADENFKKIPILMVTAVSEKSGFKFSPQQDNVDQNWIPVDDFIEKPIQSENFLKKVAKLLKES